MSRAQASRTTRGRRQPERIFTSRTTAKAIPQASVRGSRKRIMGSRSESKRVSLIFFAVFLMSCMRHSALLKYASARRVTVKERRPGVLLISGGTIHSGSCIESVTQQRNGSEVTLVVKLVPANGHCSGEFFALVSSHGTKTIKLGIPSSSDPQELDAIWNSK